MDVQGKIKMQAHPTSGGVVMDIAAFKVSHSVGVAHKDATALQAKKRSA